MARGRTLKITADVLHRFLEELDPREWVGLAKVMHLLGLASRDFHLLLALAT